MIYNDKCYSETHKTVNTKNILGNVIVLQNQQTARVISL